MLALIRPLLKAIGTHRLLALYNFWPPYFFAGIRVGRVSPDLRSVEMTLKLSWYNRNYVGTHFGGNLYAMIDPQFMIMLLENLGPRYIVWDKAATIRFKKPGRGTVTARFNLSEQQILEAKHAADRDGKCERTFLVNIIDEAGDVVAEAEKLIYIRRKDQATLEKTTARVLP